MRNDHVPLDMKNRSFRQIRTTYSLAVLAIVLALIGAAVAGCGGSKKSGSGSNMPASGTSTGSTTTNKSGGGGGSWG